jgi:glycosyltransferase involved in cell wall biosynthesis
MNERDVVVAYLSPALPALSETFVYEELLAVERAGVRVVPVAVRRSSAPVPAQQELAARVTSLYACHPVRLVLGGIVRTVAFGKNAGMALRQLALDIWECGPHRLRAWKLVYQFLAATALARKMLIEKCTHLHVHFADTPGQIAMYASTLSGVPFTIMAHANDIFDSGMLLQRKAERASRILTISEYNCQYLESLGIPSDRLSIVRCGVSFMPKLPVSNKAFRKRYRVGSLGRMVEKKGFDVLLRAVAMLHKAGQEVDLTIAGDGPLMLDLKRLAIELGIGHLVQFEGVMPHNRVAAWLQDLDLFVLACKQDRNGDMDGIPVVLMEAMSQSIPVVSTRISGIPELILHNKTGLLANPDDAIDLALQIDRLAMSSDLRESLIQQAFLHVTHEFGQAVNIERLLGHFKAHHNTGNSLP